MHKTFLIIKREFLSRIRKPSFIIMSILGPLIFSSTLLLPAWFASIEDHEVRTIAVVDSSHLFRGTIQNTEHLKFEFLDTTQISDIRSTFSKRGYWGVLYISHVVTYTPGGVILFSHKHPNLGLKLHIKTSLEKEIEKQKLRANNIHDIDNILKSIRTDLTLRTVKLTEDGRESETDSNLATIVAYVCGVLIYMFIFLFGSQVMRGVVEEKSNRVIEVIISSVKPFQLMMGKIVGIGLLGLAQFIIWCLFTFGFVQIAQKTMFPELSKSPTELAITQDIMDKNDMSTRKEVSIETESSAQVHDLMESMNQINFGFIILSFVFFFIGGYLLYGSMFAAIGSAGDTDTDIQQFVLPVTIPLIISIFIMINTINDPDSSLSFWASMIPLTSPIVMMARIPYGVPIGEFILSGFILIVSFLATTWLAAKIYRTGILMYGKKISYKEMWKWLRYKN